MIEAAERGGWEVDLISAAFREQPRNAHVAAIYQKYGLDPEGVLQSQGKPSSTGPAFMGAGFQRKVNELIPYIDIGKLVEVSGQVCFININDEPWAPARLSLTTYGILWRFTASAIRRSVIHLRIIRAYPSTRLDPCCVGVARTECCFEFRSRTQLCSGFLRLA